MSLFDQQQTPFAPPAPSFAPPGTPPQQQPQGGQNPWAMIAALMGQHSGYNPMGEAQADLLRLQGLRHNPQGDANLGYVPGIDSQSNPFSNGFFNSQASQMTQEARLASQGPNAMNQWGQLGQVQGVDPVALQQANQQRQQAFGQNMHLNQQPAPHFQSPPLMQASPYQHMLPGGGFEQIINPGLPDSQKYGDSNFSRLSGSVRYVPQLGNQSPQPGFSFGNLR